MSQVVAMRVSYEFLDTHKRLIIPLFLLRWRLTVWSADSSALLRFPLHQHKVLTD